jgi:CxxC motif-containing protein
MSVMEKKKKPKKKRLMKQDLGKPTKNFICIICPTCCELETDGSGVVGARCPKGEEFARQEWISPLRTLTTTVPAETPQGVRMVPVKSADPVPLSEIPAIMRRIKTLRLHETPPIGARIAVAPVSEPLVLIVTGE